MQLTIPNIRYSQHWNYNFEKGRKDSNG